MQINNIGEPIEESEQSGSIIVQRIKETANYGVYQLTNDFVSIEHSKFYSLNEYVTFLAGEYNIQTSRPLMQIYSIWQMFPEDFEWFTQHLLRNYSFLKQVSEELSEVEQKLPLIHLITDGQRTIAVNTGQTSFVYYLLPEINYFSDLIRQRIPTLSNK